MNFSPKLLPVLMMGLWMAIAPLKRSQVMAQVLEQSEIRSLAREITVKIVNANTSSNGSGVLFNHQKNVYSVLTNQHVAGNKGDYDIYTPDGQKHKISFKEEIPGLDLMVVQFQSDRDYETAELGDSEKIAPLQLVYVAGYPAIQSDLDIVDGKIRSIRQEVLQNPQDKLGYALVYTNQTLPGSSGGAILDERGYLVGINGEAERDITSGRDVSRGIPINLFISFSFNYLPEDQFEIEEVDEPEEDREEEEYRVEVENEDDEDDEDDNDREEKDDDDDDEEDDNDREEKDDDDEDDDDDDDDDEEDDDDDDDEEDDDEIAYLPTISNNSNYSLAYNVAQGEDSKIRSVAITPDGRTIVTGGGDRLKIWHGHTGNLEQTLMDNDEEIKAIALSADGNIIVSSGEDKIKIWNRYTGKLERTLEGHQEEINSIALSLNGDIIVSGGEDSKVRVWNRYTGKLERTLEGHEEEIKSVAISADGNTIVSGGQDREIKVWNWRSWELKHTLKGHKEEVRTVAISADGNTIVSGAGDKTIKVWDLSGQLKATLRGHESKVDSLVLSSDGHIISGSRDRTIKIWDLQTQTLEQSLSTDDSDGIRAVATSANQEILVTADADQTLAIWHLKK